MPTKPPGFDDRVRMLREPDALAKARQSPLLSTVATGQTWRNVNGGLYVVMSVGSDETQDIVMFRYSGVGATAGASYVRSLQVFLQEFKRAESAHDGSPIFHTAPHDIPGLIRLVWPDEIRPSVAIPTSARLTAFELLRAADAVDSNGPASSRKN
jgi:hypothetical protein